MTRRHLLFAACTLAIGGLYGTSVVELLVFSWSREHLSHIVLVPAIAAVFVFTRRSAIFSVAEYSKSLSVAPLAVGLGLLWFGREHRAALGQNDYLSAVSMSLLCVWLGGFIFCYGTRSLKAACFPMCFLLFMVPMPTVILEAIIGALQTGSTFTADGLFRLLGVPFIRSGTVFVLPGLTVEVAEECSGIRSSIALVLTGLLLGELYLRRWWARAILVVLIVPVAVLKNGLRIVTLSWLAAYQDRAWLSGDLHNNGGIAFFVVALLILGAVVRFLQRFESRHEKRGQMRRTAAESNELFSSRSQ